MEEETLRMFTVSEEEAEMRLDRYLALLFPDLSRTFLQGLIRDGNVLVGGERIKPSHLLKGLDNLSVRIPPLKTEFCEPEAIPLEIVYEDEEIVVVDKPAQMVVHPAPGNRSGTLVNALLHHCGKLSGIGAPVRPGIVHRLDKNTTGLLVVAKTDRAHRFLTSQIAERSMKRIYQALVWGEVREGEGSIDAPVGRDRRHRERMTVNRSQGKPAVTHFRVVQRSEGLTLVELSLETGRTHQIRVHMRYLGHPVVGDPEYGWPVKRGLEGISPEKRLLQGKLKKARTQLLHATRLSLVHPLSGREMTFESPPPSLFRQIAGYL